VQLGLNASHTTYGLPHVGASLQIVTEATVKCEVFETLVVFPEFSTAVCRRLGYFLEKLVGAAPIFLSALFFRALVFYDLSASE